MDKGINPARSRAREYATVVTPARPSFRRRMGHSPTLVASQIPNPDVILHIGDVDGQVHSIRRQIDYPVHSLRHVEILDLSAAIDPCQLAYRKIASRNVRG